MTIKTKFEIGQEVYVIFKAKYGINVCRGKIQQIVVSDKIEYYIDTICEEFGDDELVDINDDKALIEKIKELSSET